MRSNERGSTFRSRQDRSASVAQYVTEHIPVPDIANIVSELESEENKDGIEVCNSYSTSDYTQCNAFEAHEHCQVEDCKRDPLGLTIEHIFKSADWASIVHDSYTSITKEIIEWKKIASCCQHFLEIERETSIGMMKKLKQLEAHVRKSYVRPNISFDNLWLLSLVNNALEFWNRKKLPSNQRI
jgi:hypothetical protein